MHSFVILMLIVNLIGLLVSIVHLTIGRYPRYTRITSLSDALSLVAGVLVVCWAFALL